jgi:hypothetical protein
MPSLSEFETKNLEAALPSLGDPSPEATAARLAIAMAMVEDLQPANAHERSLAIAHVLACYQMLECLRLANQPDTDPRTRDRNRSMALAMHRQSLATLRLMRGPQRSRGNPMPAIEPAAPPQTVEPKQENLPTNLTPVRRAVEMAEDFARRFPARAARIRRAKGLPEAINYEPPHPAVVDAIVFGLTPKLRRLDRLPV